MTIGQFTVYLYGLIRDKVGFFIARQVLRILYGKVLFYSLEYGRKADVQGLFYSSKS